ncbi:hypothetical protein AB0M28_03945 [Streptomyces sp. NPDC051940]|uniref:hypothetical protein n=1 Tax=Streptomyces sp. NPDC051940 TaxID=3155675 RepID=UPI00344A0677
MGVLGRAGHRWAAWVAAVTVMAVGGGLALATGGGDGGGARRAAGGSYAGCQDRDAAYDPAYPDFSADDAQDWVSFGDHVAVFRVRPGSERTAGRGDRSAELVVDQVLFSREGAGKLPRAFRAPLTSPPCRSWVKEGHTYLGLIVRDRVVDGEPAVWRPVPSAGILPYDGEKIGTGEIEGKTGTVPYEDQSPFELARQMHGQHALTLQSLLLKAEPYGQAARHPELPPGERFDLVQKEREARSAKYQ